MKTFMRPGRTCARDRRRRRRYLISMTLSVPGSRAVTVTVNQITVGVVPLDQTRVPVRGKEPFESSPVRGSRIAITHPLPRGLCILCPRPLYCSPTPDPSTYDKITVPFLSSQIKIVEYSVYVIPPGVHSEV